MNVLHLFTPTTVQLGQIKAQITYVSHGSLIWALGGRLPISTINDLSFCDSNAIHVQPGQPFVGPGKITHILCRPQEPSLGHCEPRAPLSHDNLWVDVCSKPIFLPCRRALMRDQFGQLVVGSNKIMYNFNRPRESSSGHCEPRTPLSQISRKSDKQCSVEPMGSEHCRLVLQHSDGRHLVDPLGSKCRPTCRPLTTCCAGEWFHRSPGECARQQIANSSRCWIAARPTRSDMCESERGCKPGEQFMNGPLSLSKYALVYRKEQVHMRSFLCFSPSQSLAVVAVVCSSRALPGSDVLRRSAELPMWFEGSEAFASGLQQSSLVSQ